MMLSDVCLTSVCLSVCLSVAYIGPKSRTERPRKIKIGTEVTRGSDTTFKVKKSKVKVTFGAHRGRRGGWAYCGGSRTACYLRVKSPETAWLIRHVRYGDELSLSLSLGTCFLFWSHVTTQQRREQCQCHSF